MTEEEYKVALHDRHEWNYDTDKAWIDQWEKQNSKYLLDQWIQETEERWV